MSGSVAVTGWALDDVEVSRVQIFRDPVSPETGPVFVGDAALIPGARPDVEAAYPLVPFSYRAGWGFMLLTNMLPMQGNGTFTLHALATDVDGHQTWLGTRTFTSDNANATKPFGTIDTPGMSEVASGTAYPNFGWTLTQQPKVVPFDGSTITVVVDGVVVGHARSACTHGPTSRRSSLATRTPTTRSARSSSTRRPMPTDSTRLSGS